MAAHEDAKAIIIRLDATKGRRAMNLQGLMAEIESLLGNWGLTAYFHRGELKEGETIEDLALKDLKKISQLLIQLIKEANKYSILLGDDILVDILNWIRKIHDILFEYVPIYQTSKKLHDGKDIDHKDRLATIEELSEVGVKLKISDIGNLRKVIKKKLSENVRRTISESIKI